MSETLYVRQRENSQNSQASDDDVMEDSDVWDDSLLIKAYNKAVDMAKEKIAMKIQLENGMDAPKEGSSSTPKPSQTKKHAEKSPAATAKKPNSVQWKAGSHCRAIFSEDGKEYEAVIIEMFAWKGTCQIMYIGYNNDEEVNLSDLMPSRGDRARKAQEVQALQSQTHNKYQDLNDIAMGQVGHQEQHPFEGNVGVIPPPPPPNVMAHFPKDQNDALSAMLMAWYMSGYHTGYYQGLTRSTCSKCSNGEGSQTTSRLN